MNPEVNKILHDFKRKIFHPVYFVFGEEDYYHDFLEKNLIRFALEEQESDWNLQILYAGDVQPEQVAALAREINMWGGRRVLVVREVQQWKQWQVKEAGSKSKSSGTQSLVNYLEHPFKDNILFLSYRHGSPDKRTSMFKAFQKNAVCYESKKIYDNKIPQWIKEYVTMHHREIQPLAATLLAEHIGNDLNRLHLELQKIFITVLENNEITREDVRQKVGLHKEYNIFELQQSISKKDVTKAIRIALYFGQNEKEFPMIMVLASLNAYFQKILRLHYLTDKSKSSIANALGIHPFFSDEYLQAMQNYSPNKIKKVFSLLREYDMKSKGVDNVNFKQADLLPELIFRILH